MKSKQSVVLLAAFAILMVGAIYNVTSLVRSRGQEALASELTRADVLLQKRRESASTSEQQLAAATKRWAEQTSLPGNSSSATVLDAVIRLAEDSQVRVIRTNAQPATKGKAGNSYTIMPFNLQVESDVPRLMAFASRLEQEVFPTLTLNNVTLSDSKESKDIFRLSVSFSVYVFPPVSNIETKK